MSKKYPEFELIESNDFPDAWVRAVNANLRDGFKSNGAQESILAIVLRDNAITQIENHKVHPQFPFGKMSIDAYCREFTYDYLDDYIKLPEEKQFSYLYFERFARYKISNAEHFDQIAALHNNLRGSTNSRQLQMITYHPQLDTFSENPPCLQRVQIRQISDILVDIHLDFRSWDVYGAMPSNIIAIIEMINKYILKDDYYINSIIVIGRSGHVYDNDTTAAKQLTRINTSFF